MIAPPRSTGGEGGIRTRDGFPHTAFPVPRTRPLCDLSGLIDSAPYDAHGNEADGWHEWRRGRDSNPRCFRTPLFESGTLNHSDTSPMWASLAKPRPRAGRRAASWPQRSMRRACNRWTCRWGASSAPDRYVPVGMARSRATSCARRNNPSSVSSERPRRLAREHAEGPATSVGTVPWHGTM